MEIILLLLGIVIGGIFIYFILRPKLSSIQQLNTSIEEQNNQLEIKNQELKANFNSLQLNISDLKIEQQSLQSRKEEILASIKDLQEQAAQSTEALYEKNYELMQEKLSQAADSLGQDYQKKEQEYVNSYLTVMQESANEFAAALAAKREELSAVEIQLQTLQAKTDAAIEAFKREEDKQLELDKYKINLSKEDLIEINRLREIAPYFRNSRAIYKIIWESYYRNNTTDMINRIVGTTVKTGIYKITNLTNQKTYIGQAADIGSRWKDHIKAGLGIDTPSNKLYTAMMKDGVENFTFEILEECARADLNNRETYWISFYRSQDYGYNMTRGGAAQTGARK